MRVAHCSGFIMLGSLALALGSLLPARADALEPAPVQIVNRVVPVQHEPQRPYQVSVDLTASGSENGVLATFPIPEGFYLIVDHVFANISTPNATNVQMRFNYSFNSGAQEMIVRPELAPDVFPSARVWVYDRAMRLHVNSPNFHVTALRAPTSGFFIFRATVVGYLVPVEVPR